MGKILLAAPAATARGGSCSGDGGKALDLYGPPIYVRKQIVHNVHVVADLERRGAIFVDETDEVPEGPGWCSVPMAYHRRCTTRRNGAI